MAEQVALNELEKSIHGFNRFYEKSGPNVTWAAHDLPEGSDLFVKKVKENSRRRELWGIGVPGSSLLDIGAGTGVKSFELERRGIDRGVGIDVDPIGIQIARSGAVDRHLEERFNFHRQNILDFDPEAFINQYGRVDGVFDYQMLNHQPELFFDLIIRKISVVMHPGALFFSDSFSSDTEDYYGWNMKEHETGILLPEENQSGLYCRFLNEDQLLEMHEPYFEHLFHKQVDHPSNPKRKLWVYLGRLKPELYSA